MYFLRTISLYALCLMLGSGLSAQILICDPATETPYAWPAGGATYLTDGGVTGSVAPIPTFTLADADALTDFAFAEWSSVGTSSFVGTDGGLIGALPGLPADVDETNVGLLFDPTFVGDVPNGGGIFVMYDDDGMITALVGADPTSVLGFATPELADPITCTILEAYVVVNLSKLDPSDTPPTSPIPGAIFAGVFTHEIGHSLNLAHTQTAGNVVFTSIGDTPLPTGCPALPPPAPSMAAISDIETMYPFLDVSGTFFTGLDQGSIEHPQDKTAISDLNPAAGWPASSGTITGTVFDLDGVTPIGGVNVVARNVELPLSDAVSMLSGAATQTAGDGKFTLNGLTPGEVYVLFVEEIAAGAYSQTPVSLSGLGIPEEFWNGPDESNVGLTGATLEDLVCDTLKIVPVSGTPFIADITLNDVSLGDPFAVEFLSFEGRMEDKRAFLQWQTATETNNLGFEVEHRQTGQLSWTNLGFVPGQGNSQEVSEYAFRTDGLPVGTHLFRLRQIDIDGQTGYSSLVELRLLPDGHFVLHQLHPNPADDQLSLSVEVGQPRQIYTSWVDMTGREVMRESWEMPAGRHQLAMETALLAEGLYMLRIEGLGLQEVHKVWIRH